MQSLVHEIKLGDAFNGNSSYKVFHYAIEHLGIGISCFREFIAQIDQQLYAMIHFKEAEAVKYFL